MMDPIPADRQAILAASSGLWEPLRDSQVFITGGTGFVGSWILEAFLAANQALGLGARAVVLTRDKDSFRRRRPHLACDSAMSLLGGDGASCDFPPGRFRYVIHGASDPAASLAAAAAQTRRALEFSIACGAERFLLLSSGAVYGAQPADAAYLCEEDFNRMAMPLSTPYGEAKRQAEALCAEFAARSFQTQIARGFAFTGPYLPLDSHFALGNFFGDALAGGPIRLTGDGAVVRSYLYGSDMAVWLWTILLRGQSLRPYNVGSEDAITIGNLASRVAEMFGGTVESGREPARPGLSGSRYVPSTARARDELGLKQTIDLEEGLRRMAAWCRLRT